MMTGSQVFCWVNTVEAILIRPKIGTKGGMITMNIVIIIQLINIPYIRN